MSDSRHVYVVIAGLLWACSGSDGGSGPDGGDAGADSGADGSEDGPRDGSGDGEDGAPDGALDGGGLPDAEPGSWIPPLGIPAPSFGVEETVEGVYGDAAYFTHYVDNRGACTDGANPGTPSSPRCTLPEPLEAGAVVEIHGGPYELDSPQIEAGGTAGAPVFLRGVDDGAGLPELVHTSDPKGFAGSYLVVEGLRFDRVSFLDGSSHVSLRQSEVYGYTNRNCVTVGGSDQVVFANHIYNAGDGVPLSDDHGVTARAGATRVWIVDNEIDHNTGDGIQFCHGCPEDQAPRWVYIGRNVIHDNVENAVDFKTSRDVVVSENVMYGHRDSEGSDGTAFLIGSNGLDDAAVNVWGIFNHLYDNEVGVRIEASANPDGTPGAAYLVGNLLHDIAGAAFVFEKDGLPVHIVGNTVRRADRALDASWRDGFTLEVHNNLFAELRAEATGNHLHIEPSAIADRSSLAHNLFWQDGGSISIRWGGSPVRYASTAELAGFVGGAGNLLADPDLEGGGGAAYHLGAASAAIDQADTGVLSALSVLFEASFGEELAWDLDRTLRPAGAGLDIGADERDAE